MQRNPTFRRQPPVADCQVQNTISAIPYGAAEASPPPRSLRSRASNDQPAVPGSRSHERWRRSEEHTSELQSLMRISYAVFCLKTKKIHNTYKSMPRMTYSNTS